MAFPNRIRVRISTDAAESISLTPVVVRELNAVEFLELILASSGKDTARILEIVRRGTHLSGLTRLRWQGWEALPGDLEAVLAQFPDPQPERACHWAECERIVLRGERTGIEIGKEVGSRRKLFRRESFWDAAGAIARAGAVRYETYSYKAKCDRYRLDLDSDAVARLRDAALRLPYADLSGRIRSTEITWMELYLPRAGR